MADTGDMLMAMYRAMRGRFGHLDWWPGSSPFEICVGAILTQNTNWSNVEKAIANLEAADCLTLAKIEALTQTELAELIRPAGYFNVKAKRLRNFTAHVTERFGDDFEAFLDRPVDILRSELLSINGIGPETADSMVLYGAGKATFVVDTYTSRIMSRHGLIDPGSDYHEIKELMENSLSEDASLFNDYHAQLVMVGKNYCKPKARCAGCPLEDFPHDVQ